MNLVEGQVANGFVEIAGWRIPLDEKRRPSREGRAIIGIRPEDFEDAEFAESGRPEIEVEVSVVEELGAEAHAIFPVEAAPVDADDLRAVHDEHERAPSCSPTTRGSTSRPASTPARAPAPAARCGWPSTPRHSTSSTPRPA